MSPISLLRLSTHAYTEAAALGVHITNNHRLFQGDTIFQENPSEHLYDEIYILRGQTGEPVAHMPYNNKCPRCAEQGIEQFVMPGKHCPRCNQPC